MEEKSYDDSIEKIISQLKKDIKFKVKGENHIKALEHQLFERFCQKNYLDECEPAFCVFRLDNSCEYIKILNSIYK